MAAQWVVDPQVPDRPRSAAPRCVAKSIDTTERSCVHRAIDDADLHWLIGILEGEGTFLKGPPSAPRSPVVRVEMTDRDVMARVGVGLARAVVTLPPRRVGYRASYLVSLKGIDAVRLMVKTRSELGAHRREQIGRALASSGRSDLWVAAPVPDRHICIAACDAAWLAGLLEGEGSFPRNRSG